jgi:hypothetical protein
MIVMFFIFVLGILHIVLLPLLIAAVSNNSQEVHKSLSPLYLLFLLSPLGVPFIDYILGYSLRKQSDPSVINWFLPAKAAYL